MRSHPPDFYKENFDQTQREMETPHRNKLKCHNRIWKRQSLLFQMQSNFSPLLIKTICRTKFQS